MLTEAICEPVGDSCPLGLGIHSVTTSPLGLGDSHRSRKWDSIGSLVQKITNIIAAFGPLSASSIGPKTVSIFPSKQFVCRNSKILWGQSALGRTWSRSPCGGFVCIENYLNLLAQNGRNAMETSNTLSNIFQFWSSTSLEKFMPQRDLVTWEILNRFNTKSKTNFHLHCHNWLLNRFGESRAVLQIVLYSIRLVIRSWSP